MLSSKCLRCNQRSSVTAAAAAAAADDDDDDDDDDDTGGMAASSMQRRVLRIKGCSQGGTCARKKTQASSG